MQDLESARAYLLQTATPGGTMSRQGAQLAISRLNPTFVVNLANAVRDARAEGIPAGIYSSYRPPGFGVGGYKDKYNSLHGYGLATDMTGIGGAGSKTAKRWQAIAEKNGVHNPYGYQNAKEWNHYQAVPEKGRQYLDKHPGLRATIGDLAPKDLNQMWAAAGLDGPGAAKDYAGIGGMVPPGSIGQTAQGRQMPLGMGRGQIKTGPQVQQLQRQLAAAGFDPGPIDGTFGPKTAAAVRAAESRYGLTVDKGVAGPQVQQALAKLTPMQDVAQTQAMVAPSQAMFHAPWDVPGPDFSIAGPAPGSPMPWDISSGLVAPKGDQAARPYDSGNLYPGITQKDLILGQPDPFTQAALDAPQYDLSGSVVAGGGAPGASATMNFVQSDQPLNQWARRGFGGINAGPELVGGSGQPPVNPPAQLSMSQGEAPLGWTAIDSSGDWTQAPMQDITPSVGRIYSKSNFSDRFSPPEGPDTSGWKQNVPGGLNSLGDLPGVNWLFGGGSPAAAAASIPPAVPESASPYGGYIPGGFDSGRQNYGIQPQTLGYGGNDVMQGNAGADLQPAGGEPYKAFAPDSFGSVPGFDPRGDGYVTMKDYQPEGDPSVTFDMSPLALAGLAAAQQAPAVAAPAAGGALSPSVASAGYGGSGSGYGSRYAPMSGWGNSSNAAQSAGYTTGIASPFYSQIAASHGYSAPADAFTPGSGGAIYAYQSNGQGGGTYVDSHGNIHSY